jgi:hypothetical protein
MLILHWRLAASAVLLFSIPVLAGPIEIGLFGPRRWERDRTHRISVAWVGEVPAQLQSQLQPNQIGTVIKTAYQRWDSVSEGTLPFDYKGRLGGRVEAPRYLAPFLQQADIIVFLDDRELAKKWFEQAFNQGFLDRVRGLTWLPDGARDTTIIAIDNNKMTTREVFQGTLAHEFGHAVGLRDSPVSASSMPPSAAAASPPLMAPITNDVPLEPDDKASLWGLYWPRRQFREYGWIVGRVVGPDNTAINGARILASPIRPDGEDSPRVQYGAFTPYDSAKRNGGFALAVPNGIYDVSVDLLSTDFPLRPGLRYSEIDVPAEQLGVKAERTMVQVKRKSVTNLGKVVVQILR